MKCKSLITEIESSFIVPITNTKEDPLGISEFILSIAFLILVVYDILDYLLGLCNELIEKIWGFRHDPLLAMFFVVIE